MYMKYTFYYKNQLIVVLRQFLQDSALPGIPISFKCVFINEICHKLRFETRNGRGNINVTQNISIYHSLIAKLSIKTIKHSVLKNAALVLQWYERYFKSILRIISIALNIPY